MTKINKQTKILPNGPDALAAIITGNGERISFIYVLFSDTTLSVLDNYTQETLDTLAATPGSGYIKIPVMFSKSSGSAMIFNGMLTPDDTKQGTPIDSSTLQIAITATASTFVFAAPLRTPIKLAGVDNIVINTSMSLG